MIQLFENFVQSGKVEEAKRVLVTLMCIHDATPEASKLYDPTTEDRNNIYLLYTFLDNITKKQAMHNAKEVVVRMFNFTCCLYLIWAATVPDHLISVIGH